uniref:Uncharacterized protein n=1 Tax=Rhabditophanes sp. KR3021 TaxID=114890 RepID=A0AC35U650_9BILA
MKRHSYYSISPSPMLDITRNSSMVDFHKNFADGSRYQFENELNNICEDIQTQLRKLMEELEKCIFAIINAKQNIFLLKRQYEVEIWGLLIQVDEQSLILRDRVRGAIDTCNIKDDSLNWLLTIHKFQQTVAMIIKELVEKVAENVDKILEIKTRGINDIKIDKNVVIKMSQLRKSIFLPIISFGRNSNKF